jgi:DNA-binding MarR family transcriptional regulator
MENNEMLSLKEIGLLDQVIHTPARLMMIMSLYQGNTTDFIHLMKQTELTWGNLSTHLSKMEEAGYVMVTKTFKGKRPQTLISLTESGRQAYLEWGRTIIKALPESALQKFVPAVADMHYNEQQTAAFLVQKDMLSNSTRDVFFLPGYHRWGMEMPPIKEMNPLS